MDPRSKKLLTLLEDDCTLTHAQLAAMCDTTVEDIEMRIKSLTDEGVILGYKAMVNWEKTSVEAVEALIELPAGELHHTGLHEKRLSIELRQS